MDSVVIRLHDGRVSSPIPVTRALPRTLTYAERESGPLVLDLYRPAGDVIVPVVIWLHGGGWFTGDRTLAPDLWTYFADRGIAMAAIEYRLSGTAVFPAQLHDVRAAIRFLRAHSDDLGLDGSHIGLWGASAGGHLAALAGLTGHLAELADEGLDGASPAPVVQAVAESYGPVDLLGDMVAPGAPLPGADPRNSPEARLLGGLATERPVVATSASPHRLVTDSAPPFQISHGTADVLVPPDHSAFLFDTLVAHNVSADLYLVDDYRHGFLNPPGRLDVAMAQVMDDGRLTTEGSAPATLRSSSAPGSPRHTVFTFDVVGRFFEHHLISATTETPFPQKDFA